MLRADEVSPLVRRLVGRLVRGGWEWARSMAAVGPDDDIGRRFAHFGWGSCLTFPQGSIFNERWISIGADTLVGAHVSLSAGMGPGQDLGPEPVVRIGDRCSIGRGSHIVGHHSLEIGDDVYTGPYVYVTDQNHAYADPDVPIGRQWPTDEPVSIGPGGWLGANVVVLPGTTLGRNVTVAAGSVVRGDFPDHCVVAGVPGKVVRRRNRDGTWEPPLRCLPPAAPASSPSGR
jgi:serine acetyltransferase